MEKTIRKFAIYGFLLGMALSILLVDYKIENYTNNVKVTTYKPAFEYIISILRFGIIGMLIGMYMGWNKSKRNDHKEGKTYYVAFFFVIFIISLVFGLII